MNAYVERLKEAAARARQPEDASPPLPSIRRFLLATAESRDEAARRA